MPFLNRRRATWTILGAQFPISSLAQFRSPPPPVDANNEYSPPTATVIIIVIALFLTVGFLSIYFRHFVLCLGFGGSPGGAWRRDSARGLDSQMVESFPTFPYSEVKVHRIGKGTLECAVCLTEFSDDEVLLILPVCSHVFHRDCIVPWLASHVTCPVCRANLEFQHRRQHCDVLIEHLRQLSDEEFQPSDQIHQTDHHDDRDLWPSPENTITMKTPVQEIKDGVEHRGELPRSHSTGHSLVGDCERFTLRLPLEVRNKLVTANQSILPAMISPRIGYRARSVGWTGFPVRPDRWRFSASPPFISRPGSTTSPTPNSAGVMSVPRNLFKLIKSPLYRGFPRYTSDIGERSSDKLWPIHRPHDLESDGR